MHRALPVRPCRLPRPLLPRFLTQVQRHPPNCRHRYCLPYSAPSPERIHNKPARFQILCFSYPSVRQFARKALHPFLVVPAALFLYFLCPCKPLYGCFFRSFCRLLYMLLQCHFISRVGLIGIYHALQTIRVFFQHLLLQRTRTVVHVCI